jgi:hypothetical protein
MVDGRWEAFLRPHIGVGKNATALASVLASAGFARLYGGTCWISWVTPVHMIKSGKNVADELVVFWCFQ